MAAAAGLALALAGCGGGEANAPIACLSPAIPADAADLTRHEPGAAVRDLTTMVFDARLAGLSGGCRPARRGEAVEMTLAPRFQVDRGAAARGRSVDLPWAVAVLDGRTDEPLAPPRRFLDRVVFNPNETRATVTGQSVPILLPVGPDRRIQDYRILVYLQLTEEELAMNRRRGPR
jgi:hypothetical protein